MKERYKAKTVRAEVLWTKRSIEERFAHSTAQRGVSKRERKRTVRPSIRLDAPRRAYSGGTVFSRLSA
jgi:hypothetical protein